MSKLALSVLVAALCLAHSVRADDIMGMDQSDAIILIIAIIIGCIIALVIVGVLIYKCNSEDHVAAAFKDDEAGSSLATGTSDEYTDATATSGSDEADDDTETEVEYTYEDEDVEDVEDAEDDE
eukprot:c25223_g1_i1.p2 GENE.c25223_g1_i1~~c25223_g1_i1.p2  ORF type:complete len:131 (+),score=42.73 c25223_g1_i1:23-394(+)